MKKVKLFCIPHAGGISVSYERWNKYLSNQIELQPLDLAGHMYRNNEPPYTSLDEAAKNLTKIIKKESKNEDFIIFGHSLGAILAYLIAKCMTGNENLKGIIVSGSRDPLTFQNSFDKRFSSTDALNIYLDQNQSISDKKRDDATEKYFKDLLKKDLEMAGQYKVEKVIMPVMVPMAVMYGSSDKDANFKTTKGWSQYAPLGVSFIQIDGDHFFPFKNIKDAVPAINDIIRTFMGE